MNDYSFLDQILHRIILGSSLINEFLFDLECSSYGETKESELNRRPVFVSGLARAGTTVLMRALYASGQFASLTYDDMPFVMAPNLWQKMTARNKKARVKSERAHGDGIEVDFDSPEALEEVFWRTFHGKEYIKKKSLCPHEFTSETLAAFETYQDLVCKKYAKDRYLSKNNNQVLRLKTLSRHCKNATILVPFRDPLEHAKSLLTQHSKFSKSSSFTKIYMRLLAHHEFGATHRPFVFDKGQAITGDSNTLDYWLDRWCQYYQFILEFLEQKPENVMLVSYQRLCREPSYWQEICKFVDIPVTVPANFSAPPASQCPPVSNERVESAKAIFSRLEQIVSAKIDSASTSA